PGPDARRRRCAGGHVAPADPIRRNEERGPRAAPREHRERDVPEISPRVVESQQHTLVPSKTRVAHPLVIVVERQRAVAVALEKAEIRVELGRADLVIGEYRNLAGRYLSAEQERRVSRSREPRCGTAQTANVGEVGHQRVHAASLISAPSTASAPSPRSRMRYQTSAAHSSQSRCAWSWLPSKCS